MDSWIEICKKNCLKSVYISADGSNLDCNAQNCELAELGKAKSVHNDSNLLGTITAVDSETGMPIYYLGFNGGKVDSKSIIKLIKVLKNRIVETKSILLERGLCFNNVHHEIGDEYNYV